jgi:hypothetical protein
MKYLNFPKRVSNLSVSIAATPLLAERTLVPSPLRVQFCERVGINCLSAFTRQDVDMQSALHVWRSVPLNSSDPWTPDSPRVIHELRYRRSGCYRGHCRRTVCATWEGDCSDTALYWNPFYRGCLKIHMLCFWGGCWGLNTRSLQHRMEICGRCWKRRVLLYLWGVRGLIIWHLAPFNSNLCLENWTSQYMCCIMLTTYFLTTNQTVAILRLTLFLSCILGSNERFKQLRALSQMPALEVHSSTVALSWD